MASNLLPVRHEMSYETCGTYDPKTKSYSIIRMPKPPFSRMLNKLDYDSGIRTEIAEIKFACPHCLADVAFNYVTAKATRNFVEEMKHVADEKISRFFERRDRETYAKNWTNNYLESLEDFNS